MSLSKCEVCNGILYTKQFTSISREQLKRKIGQDRFCDFPLQQSVLRRTPASWINAKLTTRSAADKAERQQGAPEVALKPLGTMSRGNTSFP